MSSEPDLDKLTDQWAEGREGHFRTALAQAWRLADSQNRQALLPAVLKIAGRGTTKT